MYDTSFIVKYKSIEEELIHKTNTSEQIYTEDDVYTICEELYRHELTTVFQMQDNNTKMQDTITFLWDKMQLHDNFMEVISAWRTKILLDAAIPDIECFVLLFNYDFFFLLHLCICECLENKPINVNNFLSKIEQI